jgi:hypothetical protein
MKRHNSRWIVVGSLLFAISALVIGSAIAQDSTTNATGGLTITSISPTNGPTTGYTWLTIQGTGFPDKVKTSDYIQDGLIVHYDGIDNTGAGDLNHDNATTTWVNLAGSGSDDLTLNNFSFDGSTNGWTDDALKFSNVQLTWAKIDNPTFNIPSGYTMQITFLPGWTGAWTDIVALQYISNPYRLEYTDDVNPSTVAFFAGEGSASGYGTGQCRQWEDMNSAPLIGNVQNLTLRINSDRSSVLSSNGASRNSSNINPCTGASASAEVNLKNIVLGRRGSYNANYASATVASVRVYDKVLTDTQLNDNYEVDQNRFIAPPTVTVGNKPCTNLVVVSSTEIKCRTPANATLDTAFDVVLNYDGNSVTADQKFTYKNFTLDSISPNRGPTAGGNVVSIFGENFPYVSADDYVQDSLVAHYDGIDNTGLGDKFHSSDNTADWTNLVTSEALPRNSYIPTGVGGWTSNGWRVTDRAGFFQNSLPTGMPTGASARSIEVIYTTPPGGVPTDDNIRKALFGYGHISGTPTEGSRFLMQYHNGRFWAFDAWNVSGYLTSGNYPKLFSGNNLTSITYTYKGDAPIGNPDVSHVYYNGAEVTPGIQGNEMMNTLPTGQFFIGGYGTEAYGLGDVPDWTIHSLRIYDRELDSAEIAQNAALDQLRYLAVPSVTIDGNACVNVAVISYTELQCTAPAGTGTDLPVRVTRDTYYQELTGVEGYSYVDDVGEFYVYSQSVNHGNAGDPIIFTGNELDKVTSVTIGDSVGGYEICVVTDQTATELSCTVPAETDYTNNAKDIVFVADGYDDLTLQQAWTYDDFLSFSASSLSVDLSVTPNAGEFTDNITYEVNTNHSNGYDLIIQTSNNSSDYTNHPNDLLCKAGGNNYYFNGLTSPSATLDNDTWAYKSDGNWLAPSTSAQTLKKIDSPTTVGLPDSTNLTFGAKATMATPACTYTGRVLVTVVGNI